MGEFGAFTTGNPTPTNPDALSSLVLTTKSTARVIFKPPDGAKLAGYMLRWVNSRGEPGPWSEVAQATVAA